MNDKTDDVNGLQEQVTDTAEKLAEWMAKRKEMNLWQRIDGVRSEVRAVAKDKEIGEGKYAYSVATHEGVNAMLRPLMVRWGLIDYVSLKSDKIVDTGVQYGARNPRALMQYQGIYVYTVVNIDKPDEKIEIDVVGHGDDAGDKGPGKATTYGIKTGRSKMFSISTGEDEEGRIDEHEIVDLKALPLSPENLDKLLRHADDLFGVDSEKKIETMCTKIFDVTKVNNIPNELFQQAMNLLTNQAAREGKVDKPEAEDSL